MAYDPERDVFVMFGGLGHGEATTASNFLGDTWEWDGVGWIEKISEVNPPVRSAATLYYDPTRQKVVLYAGYRTDNEENYFL